MRLVWCEAPPPQISRYCHDGLGRSQIAVNNISVWVTVESSHLRLSTRSRAKPNMPFYRYSIFENKYIDRKIFLNTTEHQLHPEPLREEVEGVEQEAGAVPDGGVPGDGGVRPEPLLGPQRRRQPPHRRGHCRETGLVSRDMRQPGH